MDADTYQQHAMRTCDPDRSWEHDLIAGSLGLAGEGGEVADAVKKHLFHGHTLDQAHLLKELGDVLWYVALLSDALSVSLSTVMAMNIAKLQQRYPEEFSTDRSIHRKE